MKFSRNQKILIKSLLDENLYILVELFEYLNSQKYLNNLNVDNQINPYCVLLDSSKVINNDNFDSEFNNVFIRFKNPFANIERFPVNTLFYNSHSALNNSNNVFWSVAIMDFVGKTNKYDAFSPITSSDALWYQPNDSIANQAPGLAGIINIYMPMVGLNKFPQSEKLKINTLIPQLNMP